MFAAASWRDSWRRWLAAAVLLMSVFALTGRDRVVFAQYGVQPPSALFVSEDDVIGITSQSSHASPAVQLRARILLPNGEVFAWNQTHTPNSDRTAKSETFPIRNGYLLGLTVRPIATDVDRGQTFISVYLSRGEGGPSVVLQGLVQDYVGSGYNLGWPGGPLTAPEDGPGHVRVILGTQPAAGNEIGEVVPAHARWKLRALTTALLCDANVANRTPNLFYVSGGNIFAWMPTNTVLTAGTSRTYTWGQVGSPAFSPTIGTIPIPSDIVLTAGLGFATFTPGLQVGDQWGQPIYYVEEWLQP
jgi:hypothetical protein